MEGVFGAAIALTLTAVAIVAFLRRQRWNVKPTKLPPGPPTMPIIGNLHQISKGGDVVHVALAKMAKVHGRVMTVWFGSWQPTVIVSDHEAAWEVLVSKSPDYAGREFPSLSSLILADFRTVISSNAGPHWQGLRRGLQSTGLGPLSVSGQWPLQESDMAEMIRSMGDEASRNGGVVKPFPHIRRAAIRLLARLCFGPDFSEDGFDHTMDELVHDALSYSEAARLLQAFPATRFIPSVKRYIFRTYELKQRILRLIRPRLASPPHPSSYANFLLSQGYPEDVVVFSIFEVFLLGVDSTGSTALWALALLVHNQEAQERLYREIESCGGKNEKGIVKVEEVGKLQYLQAVVKETLRMKPIAPMAMPHETARDTVLDGTTLGEGTTVMVNLYALHYDPKVWVEPERFVPERFMENGRQVQVQAQSKKGAAEQYSFLPFGAGMRACAGMEVGKLQVAFAVANLVNAFRWACAAEGKMPDLTEHVTFVLAMKTPLEARIAPRGQL